MSRPADERFTSLPAMDEHFSRLLTVSKATVVASRRLEARPVDGPGNGIAIVGPGGNPSTPTHWAFGQIAQRAGAPAGYLRGLPAPLAADCLNFGLKCREIEDLGVLLQKSDSAVSLAAVTGPNYGRIWNRDVVRALITRFGDGVTGSWKVPGEFGQDVSVTKKNTTLFASDRDMFVFLADEQHRIELPNRRAGRMGTFARGFFVKNSEVGATTLDITGFLFDYTCCNRIVWGVEDMKTIKIRHTAKAPDRFVEEIIPALRAYSDGSARPVLDAIEAARQRKITGGLANEDAVRDFLSRRFTRSQATAIEAAHLADEGRPIETMWDAVVGATAYARQIEWQDERVEIEAKAGLLMHT